MKILIKITLLFVSVSCFGKDLPVPNNEIDIVSIIPGNSFNYKLRDSNKFGPYPARVFSVPNIGPLGKYYYDYKVMILKSTNKVIKLVAERAYANVADCLDIQNKIVKILRNKYPAHVLKEGFYTNSQSDIKFDIMCGSDSGDPYKSLHLNIVSKKQEALLREELENVTN